MFIPNSSAALGSEAMLFIKFCKYSLSFTNKLAIELHKQRKIKGWNEVQMPLSLFVNDQILLSDISVGL